MASRRHHGCSHHQTHHNHISPLTTSSRPCCTQPPDNNNNNILNLLAAYLQNQQQEQQCPDQTCSCETHCLRFTRTHVPRGHDNLGVIISCLVRKIDDLESSLNDFYESQRRDRYSTLRDSAARVIQTRFRSFLVSRSVSFRHVKELAKIKSCFLSLKSSVLGKPIFPFKAVSKKVTDLLLQLECIEGKVDPMIRSSKGSLSRDLVRFLQYVDECAIKRFDFVSKSRFRDGVAEEREIEKLRKRIGKLYGEEEDDSDNDEDVPVIVKRKVGNGSSRSRDGVAEEREMEKLRKRIGKLYVSSGEEEDDGENDEDVPVVVNRKVGSGGSRSRVEGVVKGNEVKRMARKSVHELSSSADEEEDSVDGGEEIVMMSRGGGIRSGLKARNVVLVKGSGGKSKVGKSVSFDEDGNVYKVYGDTTTESSVSEEDGSTSGSNDGNGEEKAKGNVVGETMHVHVERKGIKEEEEDETNSEDGVSSSEGSEGDAVVTKNATHSGNNEHKREIQSQKGNLMFSPPLPLKMEP